MIKQNKVQKLLKILLNYSYCVKNLKCAMYVEPNKTLYDAVSIPNIFIY